MGDLNENSPKKSPAFWSQMNNYPGTAKPVYGAQHKPFEAAIVSAGSTLVPSTRNVDNGKADKTSPTANSKPISSKSSAFNSFEKGTFDAWSADEDEIILANSVKISVRDVKACALKVIEDHQDKAKDPLPSPTSNKEIVNPVVNKSSSLPVPLSSSVSHLRPSSIASLDREHRSTGGNTYSLPLLDNLPGKLRQKIEQFNAVLSKKDATIRDLRDLAWTGVPPHLRPVVWRHITDYVPLAFDRRQTVLDQKRNEYHTVLKPHFESRNYDGHREVYKQIKMDVPRMCPVLKLFQQQVVQDIFERILFIWAHRHPASGYVQGMNDLVTPFFVVFLTQHVQFGQPIETFDVSSLDPTSLDALEADTFFCVSRLLDAVQDHYTPDHQGIRKKLDKLQQLVERIDKPLHQHLSANEIEYFQFAFRWMNNLLSRELPLHCCIRLWDTYLAESDNFADFHLYVCAAFLCRFSTILMDQKDFQNLMITLQSLPTQKWSEKEIDEILAVAFCRRAQFAEAQSHLKALQQQMR